MNAYLIAIGHMRDPAKLAAYAKAADQVIARFGGRRIARGSAKLLEGTPMLTRTALIIEFPSREALDGFWQSPDYQDAKLLRAGLADLEIVAVNGL